MKQVFLDKTKTIKSIKVNPRSIAIVGWEDGGAGQVQAWLESSSKHEIACFVNPQDEVPDVDIARETKRRESKYFNYPSGNSFKGRPLLSSDAWADILLKVGIKKVLVMTSCNRERLNQINLARSKGLKLVSAIHPSAVILEGAVIHDNVIIYPKVIVGYGAELYPGVVLNTGSQVDHHNVVYSCVSIDPGVVTAGNVTLHECAKVHTGAVIINKIRVGADAVIGAGSVIINDVPDRATVVGVPGKIIKQGK